MTKPKFTNRWNTKRIPTKTDTVKMTVPGLALTNKQHLTRIKNGLQEQAVKVIFDPLDLYPEINALDLVERKEMIKNARQTVADIKTAKEKWDTEHKAMQAEKLAADELKREEELFEKFEKQKGGK